MSKSPGRYETERIAKALKLYLRFFKTFDYFTGQMIQYYCNVICKCQCSSVMDIYTVDSILGFTRFMDFIHFRGQISRTGPLSVLR